MQFFHNDQMPVAGKAGFLSLHLFNTLMRRRNLLGHVIGYFNLLLDRGTASYTA